MPPRLPASMYFLALSQAPPAFAIIMASRKPGGDGAYQQAAQRLGAEYDANDYGGKYGYHAGQHHLSHRAPRADVNGAGIVRRGRAFEQPGYLAELPPDLLDHRVGGAAHGLHRESAEQEGHERAQKQAHEYVDVGEVEYVYAR